MMKNIIIFMAAWFILAAMISSAAGSDVNIAALKKEKTSLEDSMSALQKEFELNEAKRPRLEQRKSDLEWSRKQVEKQIADYNTARDRLLAKIDTYKADVYSHDLKCSGTVETQSEYDRCISSKNTLDSRKSTLEQEMQYNEGQRTTLSELVNNQNTQEAALQKEIDAYNAHRQELLDAGNKIQARLDEIQPYLNSCEEAIKAYDQSSDPMADGTMERMKAECGSMFDGR